MRDKFDHARGWFLKAESDLNTAKRMLENAGPTIPPAFMPSRGPRSILRVC